MNILIIDNGTKYINSIKKLLAGHTYKVVKYYEIDKVNKQDFDSVILSGGHYFPINGNEKLLQAEIELIRNSKKPIFGICFGFQLIAFVFGSTLEPMSNRRKGILDISIVKENEIFAGIPNLKVFENHNWVVRNVNNDLVVLANSKDGIEVIKHKSKSIYGVQFHPERYLESCGGVKIFNNFLELVE